MGSKFTLPNGQVKSVWKNADGYLMCKIGLRNRSIHRLVYEMTQGEIPEGLTINHKDGNKYNNNTENLEIMTHSENAKHSWKNGLGRPCKGEMHGRSVLDDIKVLTIITMPKNPLNGIGDGWTHIALSDIFGVSVTRIGNIRSGREWKHIHNAIRNNSTDI